MKKEKVLELLVKHEDEIRSCLEEAYKDAITNQHLQFHVELYEDGEVENWYSTSGSNDMKTSTFNGNSVCLHTFDMQLEIPSNEEMFYLGAMSEDLKKEFEESEEDDVWKFLYDNSYKTELDEANEKYLVDYIDLYKDEDIDEVFNSIIAEWENKEEVL